MVVGPQDRKLDLRYDFEAIEEVDNVLIACVVEAETMFSL